GGRGGGLARPAAGEHQGGSDRVAVALEQGAAGGPLQGAGAGDLPQGGPPADGEVTGPGERPRVSGPRAADPQLGPLTRGRSPRVFLRLSRWAAPTPCGTPCSPASSRRRSWRTGASPRPTPAADPRTA